MSDIYAIPDFINIKLREDWLKKGNNNFESAIKATTVAAAASEYTQNAGKYTGL
jgi:hypothetical protein